VRFTVARVVAVSAVLFGLLCGRGRGDEKPVPPAAGPLKVGIASADITPDGPVWMRGFAARKKPSEGVYRKLTATCVVLDNGATRLGFVVFDLCAIQEKQLDDLRAAAEKAGIPPQHVMTNCSHSHYGPHLGHKKNAEYSAEFKKRTDPLFEAAVADLQPAVLDYMVGSCTMAVNRRQYDAEGKAMGMRPEPRKPIDPDVPVLRVLSADGKVRAVLFGYACHPTTVNALHYKVGTDYPGFARDWIAAAYPGCTPVFLQGCGGDIKPRYTLPQKSGYGRFGHVLLDQLEIVAELGHELGRAVVTAVIVPPEPVPATRPTKLEDAIQSPVHLAGIVEKVSVPNKKAGRPPHTIYMGAWRIGDVYIFGSQCEVCCGIGLRIKRELAGMRVWTNGYTHWGGGYIPDAELYPEGGYEVKVSSVAPGTDGIVVSNALRYIKALKNGQDGLGAIHEPPAPKAKPEKKAAKKPSAKKEPKKPEAKAQSTPQKKPGK